MATTTYTFRTRGAVDTREALLRAKALGKVIPCVSIERVVDEDGRVVYVFSALDPGAAVVPNLP